MKTLLRDFIQMFLFLNLLLLLFMLLLSLVLFGEWQLASKFLADFTFVIGFSFIWVWLKDQIAFRPTSDPCQEMLALSTFICEKRCSGKNFTLFE